MAQDTFLATVYLFAGNFAPRGYLTCQGQLLSIAQNTALFSLLGTTFGGNGQTTFALPDLQGRLPIGAGQGAGLPNIIQGEIGGANSVTMLQTNLPQHNHTVTVTINAAADGRPSSPSPAGASWDSIPGEVNYFAEKPDGTTIMNAGCATAVCGVTGGSQPINVQNPFLGMIYIIAVEGIFPSRG